MSGGVDVDVVVGSVGDGVEEEIGFVFFLLSCMTVRMSLGKNILFGFDEFGRAAGADAGLVEAVIVVMESMVEVAVVLVVVLAAPPPSNEEGGGRPETIAAPVIVLGQRM